MKNPQKTIGYILLFPPLLSVLLFIISLLIQDCGEIASLHNLSSEWSGGYGKDGGYMSSTPIYFGLMALAGAYLIKNSNKNKHNS